MTIGEWIEQNNIDTTKEIDCSYSNITSLKGITELDIDKLMCDMSKEQVISEYKRMRLFHLLIK